MGLLRSVEKHQLWLSITKRQTTTKMKRSKRLQSPLVDSMCGVAPRFNPTHVVAERTAELISLPALPLSKKELEMAVILILIRQSKARFSVQSKKIKQISSSSHSRSSPDQPVLLK